VGKAPVCVRSFENCFSRSVRVRFGDCDPAGIVFYPRYFEMFNNLVEDWCADGLGISFRELHTVRGLGLPTVSIAADFSVPSKLGDELDADLSVRNIGASSITLSIRLQGPDGADRVSATVVLALMDLQKACAKRIPDGMRAQMAQFQPPEYIEPPKAR
jgi:4-hydroxybenzoyl-CoA thioesterase